MEDYGHWTNLAGDLPDPCVGFIYRITNITNSKKYLGRKLLKFAKCRAALKGNKNKRRSLVESDWKTYVGSCKELQEDITKIGKDNFKFEILCWCKAKLELNYMEVKYIIDANAIFDPNYYNKYVGCRLVNRAKK